MQTAHHAVQSEGLIPTKSELLSRFCQVSLRFEDEPMSGTPENKAEHAPNDDADPITQEVTSDVDGDGEGDVDVDGEEMLDEAGEPMGKRARRRAFRKDEILRTALDLVNEGGLDAVTTTELAKRTGAALGALYRFFPSKHAVIMALQERAIEGLASDMAEATAATIVRASELNPTARPLAPLITMADTFFGLAIVEPARARLIDELLSKPFAVYSENDARLMEAPIGQLMKTVSGLVGEHHAARNFSGDEATQNAERFGYILWASMHGATHVIKRDRLLPERYQSGAVAGSMLRLLLLGLGAVDADINAAAAAAAPRALKF